MTIPDSLQTLGAFFFHDCYKLVPDSIDVSNYNDATSEIVAHLRDQQLLDANPSAPHADDFMATVDWKRLLVGFLMGDTLMKLMLTSKAWKVLAEEVDEGVASGAMMVHGGKDMSSITRKERHELVTRVIFLVNIAKVGMHFCKLAVNLVVVDIPEGIESIGREVFYRCSSLTTVSFPTTLTLIGKQAFGVCPSLDNVDLRHTNLQKLEDLAFADCSELKLMTIPDSLQTLGSYVFYNYSKLVPSNIIVDGSNAVVAHLRSKQSNP